MDRVGASNVNTTTIIIVITKLKLRKSKCIYANHFVIYIRGNKKLKKHKAHF